MKGAVDGVAGVKGVLMSLIVSVLLMELAKGAQKRPVLVGDPNKDRHDVNGYTDKKRTKRAANIIGRAAVIGFRAVKKLRSEAKPVPSVSKFNEFVKSGGYVQGLTDLLSMYPENVRSFNSKEKFGWNGFIGDRELILTYHNKGKKSTLDMIKLQDTKNGDSPPGILTDRITYPDHIISRP